MVYGDPRCTFCKGTGYKRIWGRVARCGCVTPAPATTNALRNANARDGQPFLSLGDMLQRYAQKERADSRD